MNRIDIAMLEARMRDLAAVSVNQTVSLFKGGIFALAAVVLLEIAFAPNIVSPVFWVASFLLAMASYNAHINTSIVDFREDVADIVIIILQMMIELLLFAVLTPRPPLEPWRFWGVIYALFQFVTAVRLAIPLNSGLDLDDRLKPLLAAFEAGRRQSSRRMFVLSAIAALAAAAMVVLPENAPWGIWISLGLGIWSGLWSLIGLFYMQRQRRMTERMLREASAA